MRFLFFLGPLCAGAPPAGGRGENLFPGDYDYIRQGRGHNVCLAVSKDGGDIDALTGATVTSRAVTRAVNAALAYAGEVQK